MQTPSWIVVLALLAMASASNAGESAEEKIARARSAAPPEISAEATVMDSDGTILAEGSNGWTCLPHTFAGDKAPMCNDAEWMELLAAFGAGEDFEADRIGISYMLQGEPEGSGVSNSNPFHADHVNADDYVRTGPHLMIVVPKAALKGIPSDPTVGGPFIMWGDTPYAHIMVPVAEMPE